MKQIIINDTTSEELSESVKILTQLAGDHFSGKDKELLTALLSKLGFVDIEDLFKRFMALVASKIDLTSLDYTKIEEIDLFGLSNEIADSLEIEKFSDIEEVIPPEFEERLTEFIHSIMHNFAFPLLALESPNIAESAKNLIKRMISAYCGDTDLGGIYDSLGIEELPTKPSIDLFLRLGGKIPGFDVEQVVSESDILQEEERTTKQKILCCKLTDEQAAYLAYSLQEEYEAIKNWKMFYNLLVSRGKGYNNVIVCSNKIGLVLCVIYELYSRKNLLGVKYIYIDGVNGIWPFFQQYLINSKTDQIFQRELRKIPRKKSEEQEAKDIVDYILHTSNHDKINKIVEEISKKIKI